MKTNKIIVDVRTPDEWKSDGHAEGSVNIPVDQIQNRISELRVYEKVTLVCRSGGRAGLAMDILKQAGITRVENLGSWKNIKRS
jgi:rhodanese-related sulfurtransferase